MIGNGHQRPCPGISKHVQERGSEPVPLPSVFKIPGQGSDGEGNGFILKREFVPQKKEDARQIKDVHYIMKQKIATWTEMVAAEMTKICSFKIYFGVPSWLSGLRIWRYHCCGKDSNPNSHSNPGPETFACHGHGQRKKKRKKEKNKIYFEDSVREGDIIDSWVHSYSSSNVKVYTY